VVVTEWFVACVHGGVTERRRGCMCCVQPVFKNTIQTSLDRWIESAKQHQSKKGKKEKVDGKPSFLGSIHMSKMSNSKSKKDKKKT
jgi:hypothetical protein